MNPLNPTFGDLLDSFNSEFFEEPCLLVHEHLFCLLKLRLSGVYKTRGDSAIHRCVYKGRTDLFD